MGGLAGDAHAAWSQATPGSWVVVEHREHALTERAPRRLTTTLVRRTGGVDWVEHRDDDGTHWTDTDGGGESDPSLPARAGVRERVLGTDALRLDGRSIRCRVQWIEATSRPFVSGHPVKEWVVRTKRWVATDSGLVGRVLRWSDLGTETRYRDGRIERSAGRWTMHVKSLHDRVRVRGRSYDCWVAVRKEHPAHSRDTFARGALRGARVVAGAGAPPDSLHDELGHTSRPSGSGPPARRATARCTAPRSWSTRARPPAGCVARPSRETRAPGP